MRMVTLEVKQERLYQKIVNLIVKLINDSIFPPGSLLPPECELAKQLGVSRVSLREALIMPETSGWITIQSGNGVIVTDRKHLASDYTVGETLYSRELVDSHCARLAAQAGKGELISQLEALHLSMKKAVSENDVYGFYPLDELFHPTVSEASQNRVLLDVSRMLWEQRVSIPYVRLDKRSGNRDVLTSMNQQHKVIVDAIHQADADGAYQRSLEHLAYVRQIANL